MIRKLQGPTTRARASKRRKQLAAEKAIKIQVRIRDGAVCRCCGTRLAESVHEIVPKSLGGKVSLENSIHVCGLLVGASPSCHTYLQRREITVRPVVRLTDGRFGLQDGPVNADDKTQLLYFVAETNAASEWLSVMRKVELPA